MTATLASTEIDLNALRFYRLAQIRKQMKQHGMAAMILSDPVNIRYATDSRNMQIFSSRNTPSRYLLITDHKTILFEFTGCFHLAKHLKTIDEIRPAITASFVASGPKINNREQAWATNIADEIYQQCGPGCIVGIERMNAGAILALNQFGFVIKDAQYPVEMARSIKSKEEIQCMIASLRASEYSVSKLYEAIQPGITENELWSVLYQNVIRYGGDYCETRLLSSGQHTNPWFQETSTKKIGKNELIALDTDIVGCYGYYSDFSRTFHSGPDSPTRQQKELYKRAYEQVYANIDIIRPGMSFKEYSEKAFDIPNKYLKNRYYLSAHGVGMTGEYPYLYHKADYPDSGYEGRILPNMTLCVESYIGEENGKEGVKLEEQILVTDNGIKILSLFPFEERLMS